MRVPSPLISSPSFVGGVLDDSYNTLKNYFSYSEGGRNKTMQNVL
jgi:hypothetical protein